MTRFNEFYDRLDIGELRQLCLKHGERRQYARGDMWLREGEVCGRIALVEQGYFRYMVASATGDRSVCTFSFPNEFVADLSNSMAGMPSSVDIVAGKRCETLEIPVDLLLEMDDASRNALEQGAHYAHPVQSRIPKVYRLIPYVAA